MRSDAWTAGRSESAKANAARQAEIELARERVVDAAVVWVRQRANLRTPDKAFFGACDALAAAVAELEELTR